MYGAIPLFSQYVFVVWCLMKQEKHLQHITQCNEVTEMKLSSRNSLTVVCVDVIFKYSLSVLTLRPDA